MFSMTALLAPNDIIVSSFRLRFSGYIKFATASGLNVVIVLSLLWTLKEPCYTSWKVEWALSYVCKFNKGTFNIVLNRSCLKYLKQNWSLVTSIDGYWSKVLIFFWISYVDRGNFDNNRIVIYAHVCYAIV